jgi:nucleotide-binding universal stress UspA family protein
MLFLGPGGGYNSERGSSPGRPEADAMFKKILVPVDLTDSHARTLDIAAHLAGKDGEVTLLHVIELIAGVSRDEEKTFYARLEKAAREHLARLGRRLDAARVAWQAQVLYGSRGPDVLRHAQEAGSDLIVLTSHRVDPQRPGAGWGTLSYTLGILSQCPVLLVK